MRIHCGERRGSNRGSAPSDSRSRRGPWRIIELRTPGLRRKPGRPFSPITQNKLRPLNSSPRRRSNSAIYIVSSPFCMPGVVSFISMAAGVRPANGRRGRLSKHSRTMRFPGICRAIATAFTASISEIEFKGWGSKRRQPRRNHLPKIHMRNWRSAVFDENASMRGTSRHLEYETGVVATGKAAFKRKTEFCYGHGSLTTSLLNASGRHSSMKITGRGGSQPD